MPDASTPFLSAIPAPAKKRVAVHVSPAAERAIRQGHPWLFQKAITRLNHEGKCGDLAIIFDRKDRFLAAGLYDPYSPIRVRILQHATPALIGLKLFREKISAAAEHRRPLADGRTTGFRLVHGENDGLPGLVVDRYGDVCVMKLYTAAWVPHLPMLLKALDDVARPVGVILRLSRAVSRQQTGLHSLSDGLQLAGSLPANPVIFLENGLKFEADVLRGQKTGFFLDQRENRARVEQYAGGKKVLNVFAYSGGFSLYAARGGASSVVSLDINRKALAATERNFRLNRQDLSISKTQHETAQGDAFRQLESYRSEGRKFDVVIIDPPSFARKQAEVDKALAAYRQLVRLGLSTLWPGGILVMASCSSQMEAAVFFGLVHSAAAAAGRPLREIERTFHPLDHPIGFKEGAYLKCLFAVAP